METLRKTSTAVDRRAATGTLNYGVELWGIGKRTWRNVVEYECDPNLISLVHYTVLFLIVYLVRLPDF